MLTKCFVTVLMSAGLAFSQAGSAPAPPAMAKGKASTKTEATAPPSAQDIANAKSEGLVWVNLGTRVYHKDGEFYGKTKRGKFMTEAAAKQGGFKAAQEPAASKKSKKKAGDQSGLDSTIDTHSSVPPKK